MWFVSQTLVKVLIKLANPFCTAALLQSCCALNVKVPGGSTAEVPWPHSFNGRKSCRTTKTFVISWTNVSMRTYFRVSRISVTWQLVNGIFIVLNDNLSKTSDKCDWATLHCHRDGRGCIQGNASKIITVFYFQCFCPINFPKKSIRFPEWIKWTFKM